MTKKYFSIIIALLTALNGSIFCPGFEVLQSSHSPSLSIINCDELLCLLDSISAIDHNLAQAVEKTKTLRRHMYEEVDHSPLKITKKCHSILTLMLQYVQKYMEHEKDPTTRYLNPSNQLRPRQMHAQQITNPGTTTRTSEGLFLFQNERRIVWKDSAPQSLIQLIFNLGLDACKSSYKIQKPDIQLKMLIEASQLYQLYEDSVLTFCQSEADAKKKLLALSTENSITILQKAIALSSNLATTYNKVKMRQNIAARNKEIQVILEAFRQEDEISTEEWNKILHEKYQLPSSSTPTKVNPESPTLTPQTPPSKTQKFEMKTPPRSPNPTSSNSKHLCPPAPKRSLQFDD